MNEDSRFELTEKNVINDIIELDKKITEEVNSENPNKKDIFLRSLDRLSAA